jgi:hypothetical protein
MVTVLSIGVNEKIPFRLFHMPCCNHPLCWVSPRLPNHCPECGAKVLLALKTGEHTRISDDDAWVRYKR